MASGVHAPQRMRCQRDGRLGAFESVLSIAADRISFSLGGFPAIPWLDFLLNPRRLRGSDFLIRWSQGVWSEKRITEAVAKTGKYFALPYGPSSTAPTDLRQRELYFERLEAAGLGKVKRPDLLIFESEAAAEVGELVGALGGKDKLPFTSETDLGRLLARAILAIECENSLWIAARMPNYGSDLSPQRRLSGQAGLPKRAVVPTIIIKEEDRRPLLAWQETHKVRIHIWHVFYDLAFGISLDRAEELICTGIVTPDKQTFQSPGGAVTRKIIFRIPYQFGYRVGESVTEPQMIADKLVDSNGHLLPYVRFEGGELAIGPDGLAVLDAAAAAARGGRAP